MADAATGDRYVTATQVRDEWPDVTPALLRTWVVQGKLRQATVGEIAATYGRPVPDGYDPDAPARAAGPHGPENVYLWREVTEVEKPTRLTVRRRGGRRRGRA